MTSGEDSYVNVTSQDEGETTIPAIPPSLKLPNKSALEASQQKKPPDLLITASDAQDATVDHDHDEDTSLSSFFSNLSTPLDTILLAHAQNLRSETDIIKLSICDHLKIDTDKFATVTPTMIKNCSSLTKHTLADGLINMLSLSEKVCAVVSGKKSEEVKPSTTQSSTLHPPPNTPNLLTSLPDSHLQKSLGTIHASIQNLKSNAVQLDSINNQLAELKAALNSLKHPKRPSLASTPDTMLQVPPFNIHAPGPACLLYTSPSPRD